MKDYPSTKTSMNPIKQFWTLVKFQDIAPAFAFYATVILGVYCLPLFDKRFVEALFSSDLILYPSYASVAIMVAIHQASLGGSFKEHNEFFLTRAIDRSILVRARSALFYLVVLTLPVFILLVFTATTTIGRFAGFTFVSFPYGTTLAVSWLLWALLSAALSIQLLIYLAYPMKYRRPFLLVAVTVLIFSPLLWTTYCVLHPAVWPSTHRTLFLCFVAYQPVFWIVTLGVLIAGQLWCERRFTNCEQ